MTIVTCCECGIEFGMGDGAYELSRITGRTFYCPNGHPQRFSDSTQSKLDKEKQRAEAFMRERDSLQRRLDALQKKTKRAKRPSKSN